ncbi:shikimate dehydrogenase [Weissella viridescens]|uniref:Shikimate dehydrogenase n=1 Tax=Weissella viridescens TaxID=1629 RepID=A0A3P2RGA7_WEIVI|nr:shikimate dehydrogenase [Weissella viridescens]RRG17870.1 shikimate dehydrogenase [Weissella viridescens]
MQHYGLIGWQIAHSMSPKLQTQAFAQAHVVANYALYDINPEVFNTEISGVLSQLAGANVTTPYKQAIMAELDDVTPLAQKTQSVNTVFRDGQGHLIGDTTDGQGFWLALQYQIGILTGQRVLLIGCGGAARAIMAAKPAETTLVVANRPSDHFDAYATVTESLLEQPLYDLTAIDDQLQEMDVIVDATTVGMHDNQTILSDAQMQVTQAHVNIVDLKYNHANTPLMRLAQSEQRNNFNGLAMLVGQGCLSQQRWTGYQPDLLTLMNEMGVAQNDNHNNA